MIICFHVSIRTRGEHEHSEHEGNVRREQEEYEHEGSTRREQEDREMDTRSV